MLGTGSASARIADHSEPRCNRIRDSMWLTWVLYGTVQATQALAGEQPSTDSALGASSKNSRDARAGTSLFSAFASPAFASSQSLATEAYSATEFRPRGNFDKLSAARTQESIIYAPMLQDNSLWQQLAEYRSQNRLRLLTLWQIRGSSISIQAGKRGVPSLQWSSSWVHREGDAASGLFDHLLPARRTGNASRGAPPRAVAVTASPKSPD
jgi:hypothetical protein